MRFSWILIALLAAGCSALSGPGDESAPESAGEPATVSMYREIASRDGLFTMMVYVDRRIVARLKPGEVFNFELVPGRRELGYELGLTNCSESLDVEPGGSYVFRLAPSCVIALESHSAALPGR